MAQKNEPLKSEAVPLIMAMLTASVSVSLSLLNVDPEKIKEIANAIAACSPQEMTTVMSMLNSFQQARIAEITLIDWDRQQREAEQRRQSTGLSDLTKLLS